MLPAALCTTAKSKKQPKYPSPTDGRTVEIRWMKEASHKDCIVQFHVLYQKHDQMEQLNGTILAWNIFSLSPLLFFPLFGGFSFSSYEGL